MTVPIEGSPIPTIIIARSMEDQEEVPATRPDLEAAITRLYRHQGRFSDLDSVPRRVSALLTVMDLLVHDGMGQVEAAERCTEIVTQPIQFVFPERMPEFGPLQALGERDAVWACCKHRPEDLLRLAVQPHVPPRDTQELIAFLGDNLPYFPIVLWRTEMWEAAVNRAVEVFENQPCPAETVAMVNQFWTFDTDIAPSADLMGAMDVPEGWTIQAVIMLTHTRDASGKHDPSRRFRRLLSREGRAPICQPVLIFAPGLALQQSWVPGESRFKFLFRIRQMPFMGEGEPLHASLCHFAAAKAFMDLPYVVAEETNPPRGERRRAMKEQKTPTMPTVRTVTIRRKTVVPSDTAEAPNPETGAEPGHHSKWKDYVHVGCYWRKDPRTGKPQYVRESWRGNPQGQVRFGPSSIYHVKR